MTCSVWARDSEHPDDEEAQIEAVESIFQWAYRAVYNTGLADIEPQDLTYTVTPVEKMSGKEIRFTFVLKQPVYDVPLETAHPKGVVPRTEPVESIDLEGSS